MGYRGPLVMLTLEEAAALLPAAPAGTDAQASAVEKIRTALGASPVWRRPLA